MILLLSGCGGSGGGESSSTQKGGTIDVHNLFCTSSFLQNICTNFSYTYNIKY